MYERILESVEHGDTESDRTQHSQNDQIEYADRVDNQRGDVKQKLQQSAENTCQHIVGVERTVPHKGERIEVVLPDSQPFEHSVEFFVRDEKPGDSP